MPEVQEGDVEREVPDVFGVWVQEGGADYNNAGCYGGEESNAGRYEHTARSNAHRYGAVC